MSSDIELIIVQYNDSMAYDIYVTNLRSESRLNCLSTRTFSIFIRHFQIRFYLL